MATGNQVNTVSFAKKGALRRGKVFTLLMTYLWRILIIVGIVILWEVAAELAWINSFLLGSPSGILNETIRMSQSGQLLSDTTATVTATIIGFIIGSLLGSFIGLVMWYSLTLAKVFDPFFVALNGLPKIALAPMIIIWFGTGMFSKVALAAIATFVVALLTAYQGTHQIDHTQVNLLKTFGAKRSQIFLKIVVPSSLPWIISAFRLNIGFALIAVVGGEFISSEKGLGRMVFVAGNLFNLNAVWVGVLTLMLVATVLYVIVTKLEDKLLPWVDKNQPNQKDV
jgi:NitT/TauT family transport system permease protein